MRVTSLLIAAATALCGYAQTAYDFSRLKMEDLGRGVVAVREDPTHVAVSWRSLKSDPQGMTFDVYRDGVKINRHPIKDATFLIDNYSGTEKASYTVKPSTGGKEGTYTLPSDAPNGYLEIPLDMPELGVDYFGKEYRYEPNDASVGDVDGDGEYEIILKWAPTNSHDNAHDGLTGPTLLDCYRLDGTKLWRIDLGTNIRSGAHYTQFMVYDLDGDGKAEVVCKTSDGTIDGTGRLIGEHKADYRNLRGRILFGSEYLTVFNGLTGEAMATIDYVPGRGEPGEFGDKYGNRSERYLAAVAYLDGVHPSVVMCRGYYAKSVLAAFDWDGTTLSQRWVFDSETPGNEAYRGQGNHNLRVADVDGDGCDEIIYGQMTVDHDGKGLYSTRMGHGDAMHLVARPEDNRLYVWGCHENRRDGTTLRDAATGEVILRYPSNLDIGRCCAADIDPTHPGPELWSPNTEGLRAFDGTLIAPQKEFMGEAKSWIPSNFTVLWDGDPLREILDGITVSKYNWKNKTLEKLVTFEGCNWNNGTKRTPCLQADILGDWREEVMLRSADNHALRIYVTTIPTEHRIPTLMEDPVYRTSVATQNVAYNQPSEPGYFLEIKN